MLSPDMTVVFERENSVLFLCNGTTLPISPALNLTAVKGKHALAYCLIFTTHIGRHNQSLSGFSLK